MDSIITINLKEITLNDKFLTLRTPKGEIELDIKQLLKEPVNSDSAYINATTFAKLYGKRINDFIRLDGTRDYVVLMEKYVNTISNGNKIKLIKTVRGKHHSGTWIHSKLILRLMRWLDVELEVAMDLFIQDLIIHSNELKIERENTKILFKPLTDSIRDIYIPKQQSDNAKKYAYSTLCNLVNIKVLGCSSKKYIQDNKLNEDIPLRDQLSKNMLDKIKRVEEDLNGYIRYAKITDYDELKGKLDDKIILAIK